MLKKEKAFDIKDRVCERLAVSEGLVLVRNVIPCINLSSVLDFAKDHTSGFRL